MPRSRSDALVESLAMLKRTPLLAGCDDATLNALALTSHLRPLAARETLYAQDDDAEMMYLVVAGVVAVILTTPDGRELIIGEIRAGEWLGEVALLT